MEDAFVDSAVREEDLYYDELDANSVNAQKERSMSDQRPANPILLFVYLVCFYASIAFPWNERSESIYGLNIAGFVIEAPLFLIMGVLIPIYFLSSCWARSTAMRRAVWLCAAISVIYVVYLLLALPYGKQHFIVALMDSKAWLLVWMMPVTVMYVQERGFERWSRHFFIAVSCYCALALVIRATPYGWGANFASTRPDVWGRITMYNDYILILAIPLACAKLADRGFRPFYMVCLALFLSQLVSCQARTHMAAAAVMIFIVLSRQRRLGRLGISLLGVILGILFVAMTLPELQRYGLSRRFTRIGERADLYITMLGAHNKIALEQVKSSPSKFLFGSGFGSSLYLYPGAGPEARRAIVDNLWVTLLFKIGVIGAIFLGVPFIYLCWSMARGRPLSSIDRAFKWWVFFMPILCLRGTFLLWHSTSGVTWATIAVAAMLAEERRLAGFGALPAADEYVSEEELVAMESEPLELIDGELTDE